MRSSSRDAPQPLLALATTSAIREAVALPEPRLQPFLRCPADAVKHRLDSSGPVACVCCRFSSSLCMASAKRPAGMSSMRSMLKVFEEPRQVGGGLDDRLPDLLGLGRGLTGPVAPGAAPLPFGRPWRRCRRRPQPARPSIAMKP